MVLSIVALFEDTNLSLPHNHLCHFFGRPEPLVVDSYHRDDPGDILNELLVGCMEVSEVFEGDGGLAISPPHLNPPLALLGRHIQMNNQVWLFPGKEWGGEYIFLKV